LTSAVQDDFKLSFIKFWVTLESLVTSSAEYSIRRAYHECCSRHTQQLHRWSPIEHAALHLRSTCSNCAQPVPPLGGRTTLRAINEPQCPGHWRVTTMWKPW